VDQPGQGASALVHGLLLTDSARYVTGQPDTKVIAAVDPRTRQVAWTAPTAPGRVSSRRSSFAELGDHVLALISEYPTGDGRDWLAIYTRQGALLHRVPLPEPLGLGATELGPYVVGDQVVIAGAQVIFSYDAASLLNGTAVLRWKRAFPGRESNSGNLMTVIPDAAGNLYVGTFDNHLRSLDVQGNERWSLSVSDQTIAGYSPFAMVLDAGRLFVQSQTSGLQAYDPATGKTLWSKPVDVTTCERAPTNTASDMEAGGGKLYLGLFGGDCLPAFNESDGSLAWVFTPSFEQSFINRPVYVRGVLYASNGYTYAIDAASGKQLAQGNDYSPAPFAATLRYDPASDDVLMWGGLKLYAYKALR